VDGIASHGHTVWHDAPRATWQFGQPAAIAERTGRPVIADFRTRDVAAGGQGAPLVPSPTHCLFAGPDWRACRTSAASAMSRWCRRGAGAGYARIRHGAGCGVIDAVVRSLRPDLPYDVDGKLALQARPLRASWTKRWSIRTSARRRPRARGASSSRRPTWPTLWRAARGTGRCRDEDIIATAVEITARSIRLAFERFIPEPVADLVISGGGAAQPGARAAARDSLRAARRRQFDDLFFDGDAKEAVAFAFLGWLHLRGLPGNVPGVHRSARPRVLGTLTPA